MPKDIEEQTLALDVGPASWPIGIGRDFLGTYDLFADALVLFERGSTTGLSSRNNSIQSV